MADIARGDFTKALFALLKETFEGPAGSIYLDRDAGLFQTLDAVTADTASHVPAVGCPDDCRPLRAFGVLRARESRRRAWAGTALRLAIELAAAASRRSGMGGTQGSCPARI
jgi:hypothetical protein